MRDECGLYRQMLVPSYCRK